MADHLSESSRPRRLAWLPDNPLLEVLVVWGSCFGAVALVHLFSPTAAKIVATAGFLFLPRFAVRTKDEDIDEFGFSFDRWPRDIVLGLATSAVVLPIFVGLYFAFVEWWPQLPDPVRALVAPYRGSVTYQLTIPPRFWEHVVDQVFVVALPEEFFYRGYIQHRLKAVWPAGPRFLGITWTFGFWLTATLFAVGHLAIFQVWRLGVFFPALLFGWLRERTGRILAPTLFHAASNLVLRVLESSLWRGSVG